MKNSTRRILYTFAVTSIVVFSTSFAILMTLERMDYRNYLQGEYSKNIYELISSVENIKTELGKVAVTGSREQRMILFEEIFRHSTSANNELNSLPVSQRVTSDTSKLLSQVGDFSFVLVKSSSEGNDITEEDYESLDILRKEASSLLEDLNKTASDINKGRVSWGEIRKKTTSVLAKRSAESIENKFEAIQKQVVSYPALIYDGPFSDNIMEIEPLINKEKEVSEEEAIEIVKKAVGENRILDITSSEDKMSGEKNTISTFRFVIKVKDRDDGDIVCEVTKHGGKIFYLIDGRNIGQPKIEQEEVKEKANEYLSNLGYENMEPSYEMVYENSMIINYIYKDNDVSIYPDQIKLKIALDDGSIVGIEGEKYLVSHVKTRDNISPKISENEASLKVSERLNIQMVRLAVIPTETNKEVLCYEFYGTYGEDEYIVYINADNGYEQKIIQIINTNNGRLTM
ncbi:MAG: germination protein YpeB [Clostridiaceae bacterium]